jgi:hypothetical protein
LHVLLAGAFVSGCSRAPRAAADPPADVAGAPPHEMASTSEASTGDPRDAAQTTRDADVARCVPAGAPPGPIDVYLRFLDTGPGPNRGTEVAIAVPSRKIKLHVVTLHGPFQCGGDVDGAVLRWSCLEDMGSFSGEAEVVVDALVVRETAINQDAFSALAPGAPPPPAPSPMKETQRAPWPCGARARLHPSSMSTVPKD